jgi:HlyD family secretion protein
MMRTTIKFLFYPLLATCVACGGAREGYDATGTFEATEVIVSAEASGKILRFEVEEGELLRAGATVGIVDTVQLYLQKRQLEASVTAAGSRRADVEKQVAATRQEIATTRAERQRFANLLATGATGRKQVEDLDARVAVLERQLIARTVELEEHNRGMAAEVASLEIQVARVEDQLRKCRVASPITGTVLAKYAEAGEVALPGKALFKVGDVENLFLRAYVTSSLLSRVKLGQWARLRVEFGEKEYREYTGRVAWISDRAEFTPKSVQTRDERANQVYAVKIATRNDGWLKIGMYGEVTFEE